MFYGEMREELSKVDNEMIRGAKTGFKLLGMSMFTETVFYLPNRFR